MRIGKAAEKAGVNVQTLRYYERVGLLPKTPRLDSGYRQYEPAMIAVVRFIKNAQELGFTLREIGELIELRDSRSRNQGEVRRLARKKIEEMDRRIRQLVTMKEELNALVSRCESVGPKSDCIILDGLDQPGCTSCQNAKASLPTGGTHARP